MTAGKSPRNQGESNGEPERVPLREQVLWLREGRDLHLRERMRLQEDVQLRQELLVRRGEVEGGIDPGSSRVRTARARSQKSPARRTSSRCSLATRTTRTSARPACAAPRERG